MSQRANPLTGRALRHPEMRGRPSECSETMDALAHPRSEPSSWTAGLYSVAVTPPRRQLCSRCTPKGLLCVGSSFLTGAVWRQVMRTSWCFC